MVFSEKRIITSPIGLFLKWQYTFFSWGGSWIVLRFRASYKKNLFERKNVMTTRGVISIFSFVGMRTIKVKDRSPLKLFLSQLRYHGLIEYQYFLWLFKETFFYIFQYLVTWVIIKRNEMVLMDTHLVEIDQTWFPDVNFTTHLLFCL